MIRTLGPKMYGFDPYIRTMYGPYIPYNPYIVATLSLVYQSCNKRDKFLSYYLRYRSDSFSFTKDIGIFYELKGFVIFFGYHMFVLLTFFMTPEYIFYNSLCPFAHSSVLFTFFSLYFNFLSFIYFTFTSKEFRYLWRLLYVILVGKRNNTTKM